MRLMPHILNTWALQALPYSRHEQLAIPGEGQTGEGTSVIPLINGLSCFVFIDDRMPSGMGIVVTGAVYHQDMNEGDITGFCGKDGLCSRWHQIVSDADAVVGGPFAFEMAARQHLGGPLLKIGIVEVGDGRCQFRL